MAEPREGRRARPVTADQSGSTTPVGNGCTPALHRKGHEARRKGAAIRREPTVTGIVDQPLNERELGHLVQVLAHYCPAPVVVAALHRRTGGDPRLVTELLRKLLADGVLGPAKSTEGILEWIASASLPDSDLPSRVFRREGDYWTITYAGVTVRLRDAKGLGHLAQLLCHPGQSIHVTELIGRSSWQEDRVATERARVAATKAITTAVARITACHPPLGAHLAATIRRGYRCSYTPDPAGAVRWVG